MTAGFDTFEIVVALLIGGAFLWLLADRLLLPPPILLVLGGTGLAFVPGVPSVELDPALALSLFVAPLVLDAAYDASLRDLRDNIVPVMMLVVVLVCLTTAVVAFVARALLPDLPWAVAVALGAVVAPPDASAAASVLRRLSPPHRVLTILEGEGLLNDGSALLIFQLAVSAATGHGGLLGQAPIYLLTTMAGLGFGAALGWLWVKAPALQRTAGVTVLMQFLGTFTVWLLVTRLGLSPILATFGYAAVISRASARTSGRMRIVSFAVWDAATTTLTILAFVLMGLQLQGIVSGIGGRWGLFAGFAGAVCGTVVGVRLAWVMGYNTILRWKNRRFGVRVRREGMPAPSAASGLIVAWSGMRGIITLATALGLPDELPHRDMLVFAAFAVVLATLVAQGLSLGPLLRVLRLGDDGAVRREVAMARSESARAAMRVLDTAADAPAAAALRREYEAQLRHAEAGGEGALDSELAPLHARMLAEERAVLARLRRQDRIGDDAYRAIEEDLDWFEASTHRRLP